MTGVTFAQKTVEKPFQKWSKDDALQILSSSPWSKTYQSAAGSAAAAQQQIGRGQNQSANAGGSNPRSVARDFGPPPIVVRLHSALPIRQALVFFFVRKDDKGNLLVMPTNKELKIEFKNEFLTNGNNRYAGLVPRSLDFKVSKMLVSEKLEF